MRAWLIILSFVLLMLSACSRNSNPETAAETNQLKQLQPAQDAKIARGRYIAENLADCFSCHSPMDFNAEDPAPLPGQKGAGGPFDFKGIPFPVYVPNITSDVKTGAGGWTDEQLGRAIREGIGHDGRILFPIMPYMLMRNMSDEDLAAVIAYIRTLPPVEKPVQTPTIPDEVRKTLQPAPPVAKPVSAPDPSDPVKYGGYLAALGQCVECHTPYDQKLEPIMDLAFSGGFVMEGSWGKAASANITADASGISYYDEKMFMDVLRTGHVKARKLSTIMPYWRFRNLTESDQKAIFAYLKSLKPIQHRVDNTEEPTKCKVCGGVHGGGKLN